MRRKRVAIASLIILLMWGVGFLVRVGSRLHSRQNSLEHVFSPFSGYVYLGDEAVILQEGEDDCGPAALLNVLQHHGIESSAEEIEALLERTPYGTSMLQLKQVAELKGLEAEGWQYAWNDFRHISLPAIVFVGGNHYVVVESIGSDGWVSLIDPAIGRIKMSGKRFRKIWSGVTLQTRKAVPSSGLPSGLKVIGRSSE